MPDVTIIIPQRGRSELTIRCLRTFRRHHGNGVPVIVVDDGSVRTERDRVRAAHFENVRMVTGPPRGVTAAWNSAAAAAKTEWLVLLNNDVETSGPWLKQLLAPLIEGRANLTGPALRTERQLPEQISAGLPTTLVLEGWCLAMARETWRRLNGFDERMRLYWSDLDFQLRAILHSPECESPLCAVADLPISHGGHATTRRQANRRTIWQADRDAFLHKWQSPPLRSDTYKSSPA